MLGLGWTEMLVIGVVALIVIGPKDLPVVMGRIGKIVGQIRRMGNDFQREINRTTGLDEVRNLRNSITSPLKKTADEIRKEFNTMTPTGPKPSGAITPADPKAESIVDELRTAAGLPAAPKSNDELAADYGFKAGDAKKPVKAAQVTEPKTLAASPTAPVTTGELPPVTEVPAKKTATRKAALPAKPKAAAKPKAVAAKKAATAEVAPAPTAEAAAKPARKPRTPKAAVEAAATEPVEAVKKPRAPRKKPVDPAGTN
jgi:sec-independent protein translocase protein TatB